MEQIIGVLRKIVCIPIWIYQYLFSPILTPCCRFYPSCSNYAIHAITHHGIYKGLWLAFCRILRCHPWSDGGHDPVLPHSPNKENF